MAWEAIEDIAKSSIANFDVRKVGSYEIKPREIGVFVREEEVMDRAAAALQQAGFPYQIIDHDPEVKGEVVSLSTMHRAKGLEFRAVVVMACDDDKLPLQSRIDAVGDEADLEEVYNTERHLLYVACTRARDHLLVTGLEPMSEFVEDMMAG